MTELDDLDLMAVRIQCERRDPNSPLQCLAGSCNSPKQRLFSRWFDKKIGAEAPAGFSIAVIQCSSGICFYWNKRRKKSQEFVQPWFQPNQGQEWTNIASFDTWFVTCTLIASTLPDLGNWSTLLLNFLHEQKQSCLHLPLFSNTSVWFERLIFQRFQYIHFVRFVWIFALFRDLHFNWVQDLVNAILSATWAVKVVIGRWYHCYLHPHGDFNLGQLFRTFGEK